MDKIQLELFPETDIKVQIHVFWIETEVWVEITTPKLPMCRSVVHLDQLRICFPVLWDSTWHLATGDRVQADYTITQDMWNSWDATNVWPLGADWEKELQHTAYNSPEKN